ncbi:hypothetical protein XELAEV_18012246mg [Xenopus laevis]|uniref:Uncharacterized protein n=1 Tax=Xenopus laevis TaxID=8355 RepID=A0A974DP61_XENLA|nr:hypothetical protein XELAEV_18012246mg [Xenopus laevis]
MAFHTPFPVVRNRQLLSVKLTPSMCGSATPALEQARVRRGHCLCGYTALMLALGRWLAMTTASSVPQCRFLTPLPLIGIRSRLGVSFVANYCLIDGYWG